IREDYINGQGLRNGQEYYYLVTAYSYNPEGVAGLKALESSFIVHAVTPQGAAAGVRYLDGDADTILAADHVTGSSDGQVIATIVDPSLTTGDTYEVTFDFLEEEVIEDGDTTVVTVPVWNLATTAGRSVLSEQRNLSGNGQYIAKDGIFWQVIGALPGWKRNDRPQPMVDEIISGGNPVTPDSHGGPGNDVFHSFNSTGEWLMSAGGGDGAEGRFTRDGGDEAALTSKDVILKWDNDPDNIGWWAFDGGEIGPLPFGLYERDPLSGEETRLIAILFTGTGDEAGTPGVYDIGNYTDVFTGWPATDWCYAYRFDPTVATYDEFVADAADGTIDNDPTTDELFARMIFASDGTEDHPDPILPSEGTVIQFSTTKPNTAIDKFRIETKGVSFETARLDNDLKRVLPVPNPYRNESTYEISQFARRIKFTNCPRECTIRVFNLAGDLIRTLEKDPGPSSIMEWNLLTNQGLPVASGVYIYHVEAKEGGRVVGTMNGKMAIFMEKERLNFF
ncbi:MAG: hypothetical protein KC729_12160, partial [Candidatus Eisenbacteria bacterium]|nr:hypothetical protein [Candidatus Eisenbacteria bacterium]